MHTVKRKKKMNLKSCGKTENIEPLRASQQVFFFFFNKYTSLYTRLTSHPTATIIHEFSTLEHKTKSRKFKVIKCLILF